MEPSWLAGEHGAVDFTVDGSVRRVTGALWLPDDVHSETPMVLLGHGASGDRYQTPIPYLAHRFVQEAGFVALSVDGPVHGLRKVEPGGREAYFKEAQRDGFVDDMVADWRDALSAMCQSHSVGDGPLGYFGLSMGTIFGVPVLADGLGKAFTAACIGLCGTTGAGAMLGERLATDAAKITLPVLFLMQLEDELFPRDGYLSLFDELASRDKRLHANPGLHPEVPAEEIDHTFVFLRTHLEGTSTRRIVNPLAE
ncbi:MAG: alpha/beta hydrolase [Pseudomonadota bacterium]